jgi:hypothetical protein
MSNHHGWLFSSNMPPIEFTGGVFPRRSVGLDDPWLYLADTNRWYEFNQGPFNWEARKVHQAPAEYRALLLIL